MGQSTRLVVGALVALGMLAALVLVMAIRPETSQPLPRSVQIRWSLSGRQPGPDDLAKPLSLTVPIRRPGHLEVLYRSSPGLSDVTRHCGPVDVAGCLLLANGVVAVWADRCYRSDQSAGPDLGRLAGLGQPPSVAINRFRPSERISCAIRYPAKGSRYRLAQSRLGLNRPPVGLVSIGKPAVSKRQPAIGSARADGITVVVFASKEDQQGFPRLLSLLASLQLLEQAVNKLMLVVPDSQLKEFQLAIEQREPDQLFGQLLREHTQQRYWDAWQSAEYEATVLADSDLLTAPRQLFSDLTPAAEQSSNGGRGSGYRVQMLLKLAVAKKVDTISPSSETAMATEKSPAAS